MAVIGLDAADLSLIEQWSDRGLLPAFARLRREGTWVKLKNRGEFPSTTVWPSIYTGTQPGKYGIYYIVQIARGKPQLELVGPEQCRQQPLWVHLGACGKHSIVVDVPFTRPVPGLHGLQLSNWGSYERYGPPMSEPRQALNQIRQRFGRYPFGAELSRNAPITDRDFRRVRRKLLSGVGVKGEMIRFLMRDQAWDFFMAVFAETHPAGHYFWDFHSGSSASKIGAEFSSTLLDVYKSVDNEIGKIAASLDGRTTLLVVSGHGMGPNHVGWHLLPEVLGQIEPSPSQAERVDAGERRWLLRLRESIPRRWRDSISHSLPNKLRDYLRIHWATSSIDWRKERVFSLPTDAHGFVRVSLKGRDAEGHVDPGPEYEKICRKISRTLKDLFDSQTGKPVVEEVFLTDEVFPGPERDSLPDLIVSWRNGKKIDSVASKKIGTISGKLPDPRSGNHRAEGFALLYGPDIAKRKRAEGHLLDIAPTILSFYGHDVPGSFDGRPWDDLVS
jgi:predicted AlkP superfamily phosphohydrolase/phosphomutase